jgi:ribosomal protein S18 acetylase RimI-like enzyme
MEYICVTKENIDQEHICCAISNSTDCQVASKKAWLKDRFDDGLVFLKAAIRGKCFIQYVPAENAWTPISADGYMHIDCLWVSGQYKGKGYAKELLELCIADAKQKGKTGLTILSGEKKQPFLSDPQFLIHHGFQVADRANPSYVLYYLPFEPSSMVPKFKEQVKNPNITETGWVLYYSAACPFTAKYVPLIESMARENDILFQAVRIKDTRAAQAAPAPFTIYSLFYNGEFVTNEILSEKKFEKLVLSKR